MPNGLKEFLDFFEQADKGTCIDGRWPIAKLARCRGLLDDDEGEMHAQVRFGRHEKLGYLKGSVSASLSVVCQRCLCPVTLDISEDFCLGLISTEDELDDVPEFYEPVIVKEAEMSLIDILEDALILAIPMVPVHSEICTQYVQANDGVSIESMQERKNPFAILRELVK